VLDRSILDRFVQGDQEAFEAVYRHFEADVRHWVVRIVRDEDAADDVLVEAFWRAYRGRARFDASRSFGAWMRRIATNAALDHLKGERRHARAKDAPVLVAEAHDQALPEAIAVAFRRLPPRLQVAATLALVEGQPYAEIAEALDVPLGTVKSRVFRAIRALRKELERLGVRP
jgi:RNA polymerase sigma-70 factor (ECF subfamily)